MTVREAQRLDADGKGCALIDGKLVRDFPDRSEIWESVKVMVRFGLF
jgi:hypothetical protein